MNAFQKIFAADDWGFSPAINEGILDLAARGWIRSVSCAANAPHLMHGLEKLRALPEIQISLHLCFTYGSPLTECPSLTANGRFFPHRSFMHRGLLGRLSPAEMAAEFEAQLLKLRSCGLSVDRLDGHHHVHLLPFVASAIQPHLQRLKVKRLRALADRRHIFSYAQTLFFRNFIWARETPLEYCNYLRGGDLTSRAALLSAIARAGERPLLVHPALYNDFEETGMRDGLRAARVHEHQTVVKFLNE